MKLREKVMQQLGMVGLLAVEMFVTKAGEVLVNEIAPRPHNSGHQTIEANVTSQYEQHLRAIIGLPLGDTRLLFPSAMVNLLGEPGFSGLSHIPGI
jgi:5-(carboxyamino)imidazole ribonucleotide synthase